MMVGWTIAAFLSGSCMYSYWLGKLSRHNLRHIGDGNPGALNLWMAAGYKLGIAGIALDFMKGFIPVILFLAYGDSGGYGILPVALAPAFGHAFSPFLHFRGGKAIAVTFGIWSALTRFEVALVYAILLALLLLSGKAMNKGKPSTSEADGFQVTLGMLLVGVYLVLAGFSWAMIGVWLGNLLLLAFTHRKALLGVFHSGQRESSKERSL
jgi:acyl phosphate:glycerol-3-phosphate acyltransferase